MRFKRLTPRQGVVVTGTASLLYKEIASLPTKISPPRLPPAGKPATIDATRRHAFRSSTDDKGRTTALAAMKKKTHNTTAPPLPELLAPAGSLDKLKVAVHYGADAVYLGSGDFSLRAHAGLDGENLASAIAHAHAHGVKCYVTVNVFAHNRDIEALPGHLRFLREAGADGLIIADPGVFALARETVPDLPRHVSTQANVTNHAAARFWQDMGASRVNLARELGIEEIRAIRRRVSLELEVFVHGALCISYSGRCSLSLYMTGRNANRGNCAHPCRYSYVLEEEKRPGQLFAVEEDRRGTYIFNSKDLCLLRRLPELTAAGADSLKIEGRMKSVYYVGAVPRLYRAALDHIAQETAAGKNDPARVAIPGRFSTELVKIGSRGYTENFFSGPPDENDMLFSGIRYEQTHAPVGVVRRGGGVPLVEIRSPVNTGDAVEYLHRDGRDSAFTVTAMENENGDPLERANPGNLVRFRTSPPLSAWSENALLRKKAPADPA